MAEHPRESSESVWDYPRPPQVDAPGQHVVVRLGGMVIVDTLAALRVLETSHPPAYYLPRNAFADGALTETAGSSFCEFKGSALYLSVLGGAVVADRAAWFYPAPSPGYEVLADYVSLYPGAMDSCQVDGETVLAQAGGFYGGWITSQVTGPFKGEPGTLSW